MRALGFEPRKEEIKKMLRDVDADRKADWIEIFKRHCPRE
jgi:hypothetical protein